MIPVRIAAPAAALALLCMGSASSPVAAAPPPASPRAAILGSEAGARGDLGAAALETLAAIEAAPAEPAAAACARRLQSLLPYVGDVGPVEARLRALVARGLADADLDELLRDLLESMAEARGDEAAAVEVGSGRANLRRFAVVGPFGGSDDAHLYRRHPPEDAVLDPKASMRGSAGDVRWVALPVVGRSGWVTPDGGIREGGAGIVYAVARVRSPLDRTAALKAWCGSSFRVTVNGVEAILADRQRDTIGDATWGSARLAAGWNRILVKVVGSGAFALRLCDPTTGFPLTDLEVGDPLEGMAEAPPPTRAPDPRSYRAPFERALADADADRAGEAPAERAARLSLAAATVQDSDAGSPWDAYRLHEAALAALGDANGLEAAWIRHGAARFLQSFRGLPDVHGRKRARELDGAAVRAFPGFVPSRLRLAELADRDDKPEQALKELQAILAERPGAAAELTLARLASRRGWEREALAAARRALDLAPRLLEAQTLLEEADRRYGDGEAARAWTRRKLELDASDGSTIATGALTLLGEGKVEEALGILRAAIARWPGLYGWRSYLAERLRALGRLDESLAEYRTLSRDVPQESDYPRREGEILEERGDKAGAVAAYRRSLAMLAHQPALRQAVDRLEGRPDDFAAPYEPDVGALLRALPTDAELRAKYPKAVAVTVLDHCVVLVRADGTVSTFAHLVYKVLDEKGVAKYGDLPNTGECHEVRAILPDGRVMLPTGLGGNDWNIEGLVPGTVLEQRYLEHRPAGPKGLSRFSFQFQDTQLGNEPNPILLSRLVVLSPEGLGIPVRKRNFPGEGTTTTKDGVTQTVYEMRDVPRIEQERGMPDAEEIIPIVDLGPEATLEDAVAGVLDGRGDSRPTPPLRDAVARVVKAGMSETERLVALYDFVNATVTGESGSGRGPTATLLQRSGNRGELFAALVRTAGIRSRVGRAIPWNGEALDVAKLGLDAFSLPFLWLEPEGAEPFAFVMGARTAPFGLLPPAYPGSAALVASEAGGEILRLPTARLPIERLVRFEVELGPKPDRATAHGRIVAPDLDGYQMKQRLQDMTQDARKKYAEGQLAPYLVGPSLTGLELPDLADHDHPLELRLEATLSGCLAPQGAGYVVPIGLPKTGMRAQFVDRPERTYEFRTETRDDVAEEVVLRLGGAWEVASLPLDHLAASKLGVYALTFRLVGDEVRIRRERHFHPARYAPHEYRAFVDWCNEIDQAEERKLEVRARR